MNREQLIDRLKRYEWSEFEFKVARSAVPKTAYETVSAFANASGGRLVFGVRDRDGDLEIVGVSKVDKVQNEFLSEQAGKGVRAVFRDWRSLGYVPPVIDNDKAQKSFGLLLVREELVDEGQRRFQARLGSRLGGRQAVFFALVRRNQRVSVTDAKAVAGRPGPQAREVLNSLTIQGLVQPLGESGCYELASHITELSEAKRPDHSGDDGTEGSPSSISDPVGATRADLISDHVDRLRSDLISDHVVARLTDRQREIIEACDVPRSRAELMERAGLTHRVFFTRKHLNPLVSGGLVRMTNPDRPKAANQRYVLTKAGVALKASWMAEEGYG